ncbi:MAG TPA: ATP-binding protein [Aggregatilineales bacterium]|nr:ATP-binding protein [Aggregatilineales bacterium]
MQLRTKILFSLVAIAIIPLALFGLFAYVTSTNNLNSVERDALRSGLDSANRVLVDIQKNLARYLRDYTQWDDLHSQAAMETPDPDWIKINLAPETPTSTFNTFNLQILGVWNFQNKLVYNAGSIAPVADRLDFVIKTAAADAEPQTKLISVGPDVYLIAVAAIRTSEGADPNGVLLFGRKLGMQDAETMTALTGYDVGLFKGTQPIAGPTAQRPATSLAALESVASGTDYLFAQGDLDYALAYAPIQDDNGANTATLVLWRPRTALRVSQDALRTTLVMAFVIGAVLAILVALVLGRSIVAPLNRMASSANRIAAGDYGERIDVRALSKDELLQLASAFNGMTEQLARHIDKLNRNVREIDEKNRALEIANAKAEELARLRGEFLATVSHELRTPLNAILGFSDVLLMGLGGNLNPVQLHQVERLKDNGKRLLSLINDVLDISRIEAGRIELASEPFAPGPMIERIASQMVVLAEPKQLDFTTTVSPQLPPVLMGDEKRIEQVVVNLLSNAFKFTEKGSVALDVQVTSDTSPDQSGAPDTAWTLTVRDTGIGIPPHALDLIFEPFRQVDGSSRRAFKGSGLGLAIAQQLVQTMGGKITVASQVGQGSTFTVTLPVRLAGTVEPVLLQAEGA